MKYTKYFVKKFTQLGLIVSLMVVAAACGSGDANQVSENRQNIRMENSARGDYHQRSENRQSVRVDNGKVEVDCSGSSADAVSTTTVNGQTYKCEGGRAIKVR